MEKIEVSYTHREGHNLQGCRHVKFSSMGDTTDATVIQIPIERRGDIIVTDLRAFHIKDWNNLKYAFEFKINSPLPSVTSEDKTVKDKQ